MTEVDLPSITSSNSKLKSLRTLNAIHKEITSILNPNLEQCRFLCPVTQIISETKHRVLLLTLIYHRQNGGEYAIFLFNENLKLRDCIPIKNYSFFVQIRNVKTRDEKIEELYRKRKESTQSNGSDYEDYEDDYTPSEKKDVFAKSNRLVLYHVVNENETQELVFSFDNDHQFLQLAFALNSICEKDPSFRVGFDQIFEIPSELENILNRDEYYDEVRGDSQPQFKPPHDYQFLTSTCDIKSYLKQSTKLLQMSQQFTSLKQQISLKSNDLKFLISQQMNPNNKRLSAKFALGSPVIGSLGMASPVNTGGLTVSEKRKSLTPPGLMTSQTSGQQIVGQSALTSLLKSQTPAPNSSQTPTPFDWVLFFIERFELDANEIEFLNPLYQNMENSGTFDSIKIVENRKDKLVEQDVISVSKDDSNVEDEYAWLLKRSEQEIDNHIKGIPRVSAAKSTTTAAKPLNTASSFTKGTQIIRQVSQNSLNSQNTTTVNNETSTTPQTTTSPTGNKPMVATSNPITAPSTAAAQPMIQSPPTIESNFMQSELLSKLYNTTPSTTINANSNNTPKSTSTPTTTGPTTKIIGNKQQQQQQQKDDSDSDISLSMSSSDSDEDEDDLDMSSTDSDSD